MKTVRLMFALFSVASLLPLSPGQAAPINYRNWVEGHIHMFQQAAKYPEASVVLLGRSSHPAIGQWAIRISEDDAKEDDSSKNAVLFECGMHAREWYAAESCYWLMDYLLEKRETRVVADLLSEVDVWLIPQSNPAGRHIDDLAMGDPTKFVHYCEAGGNAGNECVTDGDCPDSRCYRSGWRANANRSTCRAGVDIARNFSRGWSNGDALCVPRLCDDGGTRQCMTDSDCRGSTECKTSLGRYRGEAPFTEYESLNLRQFVNNHMLSMAAVVHGPDQKIWNLWYNEHAPSRTMTDRLAALSTDGVGGHNPRYCRENNAPCFAHADCVGAGGGICDAAPMMPVVGVGDGGGQFSGWLARTSDATGDLDQGTRRAISTFFFEVPMVGDRYAPPYQEGAMDGSNIYHLSGQLMEDVWEDMLRELFLYVIRQARSPACPVGENLLLDRQACLRHDYGLTGAKISSSPDAAGSLEYDVASREETLALGSYQIVYAVQNFSASEGASTEATVTVRRDGVVVDQTMHAIALATGMRETFSVPLPLPPGPPSEYQVTISLADDGFWNNNRKTFKFRTRSPLGQELATAAATGRVKVRRDRRAGTDTVRLRAKLETDAHVRPDLSGLVSTLFELTPHETTELRLSAPAGSRWSVKDRRGRRDWSYEGEDGVEIRLTERRKKRGAGYRLSIIASAAGVEAGLTGAQAFAATVHVDLEGAAGPQPLEVRVLARGKKPRVDGNRPLPIPDPLEGPEHE